MACGQPESIACQEMRSGGKSKLKNKCGCDSAFIRIRGKVIEYLEMKNNYKQQVKYIF